VNGISSTQLRCFTTVLRIVIHCVLFRINTYAWLLSLYIVFRYVLFSTLPFTQAKVKIKGKAVLHRTVTAYCLLWGVVKLSVDVI